MGWFSNNNNHNESSSKDLPVRKVEFVPANDEGYLAHYEVLEKKLFKWEPLMTWHPMSGDRPMMFDSQELAEQYIIDLNKIVTDREKALKNATEFGPNKIIFIPANMEYVEHYEVLEKGLLGWKPVMTWHEQSGDRPMMFDSLLKAENFIREYVLGEAPKEEENFVVKNNVTSMLNKKNSMVEEENINSKKIKI